MDPNNQEATTDLSSDLRRLLARLVDDAGNTERKIRIVRDMVAQVAELTQEISMLKAQLAAAQHERREDQGTLHGI